MTVFLALLTAPAVAQSVRIGTYDSRAVALAYYNSSAYQSEMTAIRLQYDKAKGEKNAARMKEIEHRMTSMQSLKHLQVFSHASIPNVIAPLQDLVTAVAKETGVVLVVSKWEIAWQDPQVEHVDVTDRLVASFKPDERVQKWLVDLAKQKPMPLVEIAAMSPEH